MTWIFWGFVLGLTLYPLWAPRLAKVMVPKKPKYEETLRESRFNYRLTMTVETTRREPLEGYAEAMEELWAVTDECVGLRIGVHPARVREQGAYRNIRIEEIT